ncbi:MAG: hypothetical protein U0V04_06855 [Spirosomataceae bacterium]|jgi:hypothetical protein
MIEIFIEEYLSKNAAFPIGFDVKELNKWFDLLYPEVENDLYLAKALEEIKLALSFQTLAPIDKFQLINGYQKKSLKGRQFFHPDHQPLFQKIENGKPLYFPGSEKLYEYDITKGLLLEELFQFEVECYEATIIRNKFFQNTDRDIEIQRELLVKIKQFKNYKPRESLVSCSAFIERNPYFEYIPISNEKIDEIISEIDIKIDQSAIKNSKFKKVLSNVELKNKNNECGLNLSLPDDQLGLIYEELVKQKYFHQNVLKKNFINAFNGKKLSEEYEKIEWQSSVNLSIIVGLYAYESRKWKKCKYLFFNSDNLRKLFNSATITKKYSEKTAFLNSIFKNNT